MRLHDLSKEWMNGDDRSLLLEVIFQTHFVVDYKYVDAFFAAQEFTLYTIKKGRFNQCLFTIGKARFSLG